MTKKEGVITQIFPKILTVIKTRKKTTTAPTMIEMIAENKVGAVIIMTKLAEKIAVGNKNKNMVSN